jgi:hypothetical protein
MGVLRGQRAVVLPARPPVSGRMDDPDTQPHETSTPNDTVWSRAAQRPPSNPGLDCPEFRGIGVLDFWAAGQESAVTSPQPSSGHGQLKIVVSPVRGWVSPSNKAPPPAGPSLSRDVPVRDTRGNSTRYDTPPPGTWTGWGVMREGRQGFAVPPRRIWAVGPIGHTETGLPSARPA